MPSSSTGRIRPWTALSADPAVRAAERAIVTEEDAVLADTLAVATRVEARRRLGRVLELKDRAERDPTQRATYRRAADGLRNWAAGVYLASLRDTEAHAGPTGRRKPPAPVIKLKNPYTEESASIGRSVPRPPFPGQRGRRLYASDPSQAQEGTPPVKASPATATITSRRRPEATPVEGKLPRLGAT